VPMMLVKLEPHWSRIVVDLFVPVGLVAGDVPHDGVLPGGARVVGEAGGV
jgi:hypothetical protein